MDSLEVGARHNEDVLEKEGSIGGRYKKNAIDTESIANCLIEHNEKPSLGRKSSKRAGTLLRDILRTSCYQFTCENPVHVKSGFVKINR